MAQQKGTKIMQWKSTKTTGVRYREHESRKHGKQKDKYFSIRYKLNNKTKEEGLGWASEGWTEKKAGEILFKLKENQKIGEGPCTLAEKRDAAKKENEKAENEQKKKVSEERTFHDLFMLYIERAKVDESKKTYDTKMGIFRKRIPDSLKQKILSEINVQDIEPIKLVIVHEI
jgi:hypothetical protein